MPLKRRIVLQAGLGLGLGAQTSRAATTDRLARQSLVFPRDAGAHPDHAIEWWYVTGYTVPIGSGAGADAAFGFQVTFFRHRVPQTQDMRSDLAAKHLVIAHAAVTDVKGKKLWHDQRLGRWSGAEPGHNPVDTTWASVRDTRLQLRDWSLQMQGKGLRARVHGDGFSFDLTLTTSQPVLLQGEQGFSQKGPDRTHSSYYYSLPQLNVGGSLVLNGQTHAVGAGSTAWLDHEWSQQVMPPGAIGWDWIGINLFDGSALTAFRLRDKQGHAVWDGGSFRANATLFTFRRGDVVFKPQRIWKSPVTQASYPVEWIVRTPADFYTVRATIDNQELDSRNSTGNIYWEGLSEVWDSNGRLVGRGYLEMTGYASPLRL